MTVIGCRSVIQYSRNPMWPRFIFFILSAWCWFSYGILMYEYGVSFKSARYLQEYGSFHFFTLYIFDPKHELAPKKCKGKLVGCFDDLHRFSDISAISQLGPSTALCRSFLKHCILIKKAAGTIWRDLSKPPQRRQGPDPRPLWLLVGTPLVLELELASRRVEHSHSGGSLYIFWYTGFYHLTCLCNNFYDLSALVGCWS